MFADLPKPGAGLGGGSGASSRSRRSPIRIDEEGPASAVEVENPSLGGEAEYLRGRALVGRYLKVVLSRRDHRVGLVIDDDDAPRLHESEVDAAPRAAPRRGRRAAEIEFVLAAALARRRVALQGDRDFQFRIPLGRGQGAPSELRAEKDFGQERRPAISLLPLAASLPKLDSRMLSRAGGTARSPRRSSKSAWTRCPRSSGLRPWGAASSGLISRSSRLRGPAASWASGRAANRAAMALTDEDAGLRDRSTKGIEVAAEKGRASSPREPSPRRRAPAARMK